MKYTVIIVILLFIAMMSFIFTGRCFGSWCFSTRCYGPGQCGNGCYCVKKGRELSGECYSVE